MKHFQKPDFSVYKTRKFSDSKLSTIFDKKTIAKAQYLCELNAFTCTFEAQLIEEVLPDLGEVLNEWVSDLSLENKISLVCQIHDVHFDYASDIDEQSYRLWELLHENIGTAKHVIRRELKETLQCEQLEAPEPIESVRNRIKSEIQY